MRRRLQRKERKPAELMLVPMIDIFTVLVTFLLMTAVFSRITILELDLPSANSVDNAEPVFRLEVIVRQQGLELTNGSSLIATIPKLNGAYDLKTLGDLALALKRDYPDATSASVLMEPEIEYDHLIQVMDAIRSAEAPAAAAAPAPPVPAPAPAPAENAAAPAEVPQTGTPAAVDPRPTRLALFTDIAVGDAP